MYYNTTCFALLLLGIKDKYQNVENNELISSTSTTSTSTESKLTLTCPADYSMMNDNELSDWLDQYYPDWHDCTLNELIPTRSPLPTPQLTPQMTPQLTPYQTPYITPFITPFNTPILTPKNTPTATPIPVKVFTVRLSTTIGGPCRIESDDYYQAFSTDIYNYSDKSESVLFDNKKINMEFEYYNTTIII